MPNFKSETITVRLPSHIAKELYKLRDSEHLPTIGSAMTVYVQKLKEDRIEKQMKKLEQSIKKIASRLDSLDSKVRRGITGATEEHIT